MSSSPFPTLILTNDDGVSEPGLAALQRAADGFGRCVVVAPEGPRSSCGHSVTTGVEIQVDRLDVQRYAVWGTPADCVRIGLCNLAPETSWVLSGINAGGNLGVDIHHSGTVAAAREAVLHGRSSIAFSHYVARGRGIDWNRASTWTIRVLDVLLRRRSEPGTFWNVNLPHPEPGMPEPRIIACRVDPSPLPLRFGIAEEGRRFRYAGDYHARPRLPAQDVSICFEGNIAVSRVHVLAADSELPDLDPDPRSGLVAHGDEDA